MRTSEIYAILNDIRDGGMALPTFQRGYVWNRNQVRGLFDSLYNRHPIGGLLVWSIESPTVVRRDNNPLATKGINLLLDGQQRMTSLYGVIRGELPEFFEGDAQKFKNLRFHLDEQTFEFYQPVKMRNDPLWVDVTELMKKGYDNFFDFLPPPANSDTEPKGIYIKRLSKLLGIINIELHIEEVKGDDKTLDVVTDIFNRVNSAGTKLSKGDLALAKICAEWPEGRDEMKKELTKWTKEGYAFNLDWLLRSVNTSLTGEAKFQYLHKKNATEIQKALKQTVKHIDTILNLISGRLGLDHDRVFFSRFGVPVLVRYLNEREKKNLKPMDEKEADKLLFWYIQSAMWGRFSGSTESTIDQDLAALEGDDGGLDKLLEQLMLSRGSLMVGPEHFTGKSLGARFYPVLYMLTRMGEARDWGTGLPLKKSLLGKMNRLERHHIFPRAQLSKQKHERPEVNALANFCFLTKDTNLNISDRLPEEYFPEIEEAHPGALASQWIPTDTVLWKIKNYKNFLEARKKLLADELNKRMGELLHGDLDWLSSRTPATAPESLQPSEGVKDKQEEQELSEANGWVVDNGLPRGILGFDFSDPETGEQKAVFDLAWPNGIQEGLSKPVAVLLNEDSETIALAAQAGFLPFTNVDDFKNYIEKEVLEDSEDS